MTLFKARIENIIINAEASIIDTLKVMDKRDKKMLLVFKQDNFLSVVSIGDVQRAILKALPLESEIEGILRKNICVAYQEESQESIKEKMLKNKIECMPILDEDNKLVNVLFWEDLFENQKRLKSNLEIPVVIMAGGKGTRLRPLTNIIPKPLIPIGDKTMLEEIMDRFVEVGCKKYFLSVNYKVNTIKHYFEELQNKNYDISYFQEEKPLGTAGSMYLLKGKINTTFFVSNCDIIINQDLEEIYKYHKENANDITMVSALKHYKIPYGTINTGVNGVLESMSEKPELTYQINTGVYILEPHVLDSIPENSFYHITSLIEDLKNKGKRVGVFPISEGSWKDIGQWDEYLKMIK